eukprot:COSAG01_NODE_71094_length_257_cov_0.525316_1_plen_34_part_01
MGGAGAAGWHADVEGEAERLWGVRQTRPTSSPAS